MRRDAELEACRRALAADRRDADAWLALARVARRGGRVPDFVEPGDLRHLRAAQRRHLEDASLRELVLLMVGLTPAALPDGRVPGFWKGRRKPLRVDGIDCDPTEGMPIYAEHPATGMGFFWIPRIRAPLGQGRFRFGVSPPANRRKLAGGGYLGRFAVTRAAWARGPEGGEVLDEVDAARPATGFDQTEARAFAAWAGGALPRGETWELAGRGEGDEEFPWGQQPLKPQDGPKKWWARILKASAPADPEFPPPEPPPPPVGKHPKTRSVFGIEELCGFIPEWVAEPGDRRGGLAIEAVVRRRWRQVDEPWGHGETRVRAAALYWKRKNHGDEYPADTGMRLWIPVDGD